MEKKDLILDDIIEMIQKLKNKQKDIGKMHIISTKIPLNLYLQVKELRNCRKSDGRDNYSQGEIIKEALEMYFNCHPLSN